MYSRGRSNKRPMAVSTSRTSPQKQVPHNTSGYDDVDAIQSAIQNPSRDTVTSNTILHLQRTVGNAAVSRLLSSHPSHPVQQTDNSPVVRPHGNRLKADEKVRLNSHPVIQRVITIGDTPYGVDDYDAVLKLIENYDYEFFEEMDSNKTLETALRAMLVESDSEVHEYGENDLWKLVEAIRDKAQSLDASTDEEVEIPDVDGWEQVDLIADEWTDLANEMLEIGWGGRGAKAEGHNVGRFKFGDVLENPDELWRSLLLELWNELKEGAIFVNQNELQPYMTEALETAKRHLQASFKAIDGEMEEDDSNPWEQVTDEGMEQGSYNVYKGKFVASIRAVTNNLVAFANKNMRPEKAGDKAEKEVLGSLKGNNDEELRLWLKQKQIENGQSGSIEWYALTDAADAKDLIKIVSNGAKAFQQKEELINQPINELIDYFNQTAAAGHDITEELKQKILSELDNLEKIKETALPAAFETYKKIMHELNLTEGKKLIMVFSNLDVSSGLSGQTFDPSAQEGMIRETTRIYINVKRVMDKIEGRTDGERDNKLKLATGTIIHEIAHAYGHDPESHDHKQHYIGVETPGGHAPIKDQFVSNDKKRWFVDPDIIAAMWLRGIAQVKDLLQDK